MRKGIVLFAGMMVFVLLFAGFSAKEAQAADINSPKEYCEDFINGLSGVNSLPGSHYNAIKEQCIVGWTYQNFGSKNICYPKLDIYQVVWADNRSGKEYSYSYYWEFAGCTVKKPIKDPNQGSAILGGGVSFSYEQGTCANGCSVSKFGLTGAAKQALGALDGTVKGKSYVQIKDDDGALVSGNFTLCFNAKSLDNPYFFRWSGGNNWSPMGGYWNGNNFCMAGTISGNYVMVDLP